MITKSQIEELEEALNKKRAELSELKKAFAIQECPHNIGDELIVNGWSHQGKKIIVDCISFPKWDFWGNWVCTGYVIKKDGTLGSKRGEVHEK